MQLGFLEIIIELFFNGFCNLVVVTLIYSSLKILLTVNLRGQGEDSVEKGQGSRPKAKYMLTEYTVNF